MDYTWFATTRKPDFLEQYIVLQIWCSNEVGAQTAPNAAGAAKAGDIACFDTE